MHSVGLQIRLIKSVIMVVVGGRWYNIVARDQVRVVLKTTLMALRQ